MRSSSTNQRQQEWKRRNDEIAAGPPGAAAKEEEEQSARSYKGRMMHDARCACVHVVRELSLAARQMTSYAITVLKRE
jgi:hypothetical protein